MILINRHMEGVEAGAIETDDRMGGRLAAERLLAAGRRKLCVVRPGPTPPASGAVRPVFWNGWTKRASPANAGWPGAATMKRDVQRPAACCVISGSLSAIDGVFAATDRTALGFLNTARFEMGVSVPQDVAVIGFDDIPEAAWSSHNLTTIRQSAPDVVAAVLTLLAEEGEDAGLQRVSIPVSLVERGTV
ncbi:substrate-binding domain-containing protein [Pannonibacter sp. Pt2-lr]